jgi:CHASE2 domain-containing sensor protein
MTADGTSTSSTPLTTRLAFAASGEPSIEIYDTYCYQRVSTIPVRDPIIGPIKSAFRNGRIVLVGATARGVVIVSVDNTFTTSCP